MNGVNFPHLRHLLLVGRPIRKLLSLLSKISVPRIELLYLRPDTNDALAPTVKASEVIEPSSAIYERLTKLVLCVDLDEQLSHNFDRVNTLIGNCTPRLMELRLLICPGIKKVLVDEEQGRISKAVIATPMTVTLVLEHYTLDVDVALACLGEGTSLEVLIIRDRWPMTGSAILVRNYYEFPHLKALILHGTRMHPLANHIRGPLLKSVKLEENPPGQ